MNMEDFGWQKTNNKLTKNFEFKRFSEAVQFMNVCFEIAEIQNHHPEIYNVYKTVRISLSTHDAGNTVTQKDRNYAEQLERQLQKFNGSFLDNSAD